MSKIEYSLMTEPLPGEQLCGDIAWAKQFENQLLLCLIDVAGHGALAAQIANECIPVLEAHYRNDLMEIIRVIESSLHGKPRALVLGLALMDTATGLINYVGVGNITTRILGKQSHRFVSRSGMLGFSKTRAVLERYLLNEGDILLMYSDGIMNRFEKINCPELMTMPIAQIPNQIITKFSKQTDDSSCIAARYVYD